MKPARFIALSTLTFLGVSAVAGAIPMLLHPSGSETMMPMSLLEHSPFRTFLVPGILLLVANGLLSFWVLWLTIRNRPGYALWVGAQGSVLAGWLIIEVWMLRGVSWLHFFYGAVAVVMIFSGLVLRRERASRDTQDFVI
jgi:hypothetical protein